MSTDTRFTSETGRRAAKASARARRRLNTERATKELGPLDTPADGGLRLSSETVSIEEVVAAISTDERLKSPLEKCKVLHSLAAWEYFTPAEYHTANAGLCSSYAFGEFPWSDVATGE